MQDSVQLIKDKLSIEEVVAPYVMLKKSGRYLKACCPFHQEKTPSFVVSPDRGMAYCFGCHKGGDIFQFIQEIEGLDFKGALEFLAEKANVTLEKFASKGPKISRDEKEELKAANEEASNFFVQSLQKTEEGKKVVEYLKKRGANEETISEFKVGFAPEGRDKLYRHLLEKGFNKEAILKSHLAVPRDSAQQDVADRFHLRLMFPIQNEKGDFIAYGGRALKKGDDPKYLNSPEYVLYNKSATLYNMHRAKAAIREKDFTVVVEGYLDVMASHQAGIQNVVATCGTALTVEQFKLMKRYSSKVALAFDSDAAGQNALHRGVQTAQPLGLELFVVSIPSGKDAADAVKENPQFWISAIEKKEPYLEYFLRRYREIYDLHSAEGKRGFTDSMMEILKGVKHPVERDHYLKELSRLVSTPVEMLYDFLNQASTQRKVGRLAAQSDVLPKKTGRERLFLYFVGLLLAFPKTFFEVLDGFENFSPLAERIKTLGLIRQLSNLTEERWKDFLNNLETFLEDPSFEISASHVYKQVRDHYNLRGELDDGFFQAFDRPDLLQKLALEAEVKNTDLKAVPEEFEKVITLLYLDFVSSKPELHG